MHNLVVSSGFFVVISIDKTLPFKYLLSYTLGYV